MVLKTWSFAFVLFMIMLLFGVVDSIGVISPQDSMENARQNPISEHNSEIKVSESGKIQVSPTIGDLMSEIPEGNRPIIGINEDGTLDLPNDHFIIPPGAQTDNAFKIYVIGDSIAWGNGLNREYKYYYLVAKELQENLGEPVEVIVYAHSGAPISGEDENSIINQAKKIPNDVDLILVSGGINDVGIESILDSSKEASSVTSLSAPIEERMENLLRGLINKNQHVKIIVTGYYNIISRDSRLENVDNILGWWWTSDKFSPAMTSPAISIMLEKPDTNRLIANSIAFNSACTTALRSAVKKVDGKEGRIVFVSPEFQDSNSYKASDTYLWGLISLVPQRSNADNHNIDAIAHPNRNGASKYADAINNITGAKGFAWLQKTTQNTTKERIWKDFPGVSRNYPWIDSVTSTDLNEDEDVSDETNVDTIDEPTIDEPTIDEPTTKAPPKDWIWEEPMGNEPAGYKGFIPDGDQAVYIWDPTTDTVYESPNGFEWNPSNYHWDGSEWHE